MLDVSRNVPDSIVWKFFVCLIKEFQEEDDLSWSIIV